VKVDCLEKFSLSLLLVVRLAHAVLAESTEAVSDAGEDNYRSNFCSR